jgi:hypothetical protein
MPDSKLPLGEAVQLISLTLNEHATIIQTLKQTLESLQPQLNAQLTEATGNMHSLRHELAEITQLIRARPTTAPPPPPSQTETTPTLPDHRTSNLPTTLDQTIPSLQSALNTIVLPPAFSFPTFSGKPSERPRQFLLRVEEYTRTVNNWSTETLLKGISQFLKDSALDWYCQLYHTNTVPTTWTQFTKRFLAQFHSPIRVEQQEYEWKECKQQENETINEFVVHLRSLWLERKPDEKELDFIKHLHCKMRPDMLALMNAARTLTLDETIFEAQQVEEILYLRNKALRSRTTNRSKPLSSESTTAPLISLFPRTSNPPRNPQSPPVAQSNITCWRCYETGHYATTCPLNDTKQTLDPTEDTLQPLPPRSKNT